MTSFLEPAALHQTRFRTPGVTPDSRGVVVGQKGLCLFPSLDRAVAFYNGGRPHASISMFTPDQVHYGSMPVKRTWKNYYPKRATVNPGQDEPTTVNLSSDINPKL